MRALLAICALLLLAVPVSAQNDDRGVVQAFLEENLSDAGREVRIVGFEGALSGRATMESLTIADSAGVWLTINDAVFDWNRGALFRGRLEIGELSAGEVDVARAPVPAPGLPSPEAAPFALPALPVSIDITTLNIARLSVDASLIGQPAVLSLDGSASLAGGAGKAELSISRIDRAQGSFAFSGEYANETKELSLDLDLTESEGGIAAGILGLPGSPSLGFAFSGAGPIFGFAATVRLSTEGEERLAGSVTISTDESAATQKISVDIGGDLRPLVEPQYRPFLGDELRLRVQGLSQASGVQELEELTLETGAMKLTGSLTLSDDGWPERVLLSGNITPPEGDEVLLSLPGEELHLGRATFELAFDENRDNTWILASNIERLRRPDFRAANLRLSGGGTVLTDLRGISGALEFEAEGLQPKDTGLATALGAALSGDITFGWTDGEPLRFGRLALEGEDFTLTGAADVEQVEGEADLVLDGTLKLDALDLSRFAGLAGADIGGSASVGIGGEMYPVSGAFDLAIAGEGRDLSAGQRYLDPLISGASQVTISAKRDTSGLLLRELAVTTLHASLKAEGTVTSDASDLILGLSLLDVGQTLPGVSGPAELKAKLTQEGSQAEFDATAELPGTEAIVQGSATLREGGLGRVNAEADLSVTDISNFAGLVGQPIAGVLSMNAKIEADLENGIGSAAINGDGQDLKTGIAEADLLLRGASTFATSFRRDENQILVFDQIEVTTQQIFADLTGSLGAAKSRLRFMIDLNNLGILVESFEGPALAEGVISASDGPWAVESDLQGPGGTTATVAGNIARDASTADLSIAGAAPLALVNRFIAPNLADGFARFDLQLNGPPGLKALSGAVTTSDGRLTLSEQRLALSGISAEARLSNGAADVSANATVTTGGQLTLIGRVGLLTQSSSDLSLGLTGFSASEPGIYETTVDGRLAIAGDLAGGAAISGALTLDTTEIRIPDGAGAVSGALPGLVHINTPGQVQRTLRRAGLTGEAESALGPGYPLDLTVTAPARVFVRGRGLDIELGGALRLTGNSNDVVTSGRFDLIRGRLDILGKRLTLSEAFAQLQGDFDPYIRAVATTEASGTTIQIIVEGPASAPTLTITSAPELPEDEILALLLFGRDISQISALQALRIANAVRVLSGKGGEGIVGRLRQKFGLDDFDVATNEDGETDVRFGKYINDNIYTDVTVDSAGESQINLNITISPSVTARGSVSSDSNTGVGIFFERDY